MIKRKWIVKKVTAYLLSATLVCGSLPASVYAGELQPTNEVIEETEEEPVEDETPKTKEESGEDENPVEDETPKTKEESGEDENPVEDETPKTEEESGEDENPIEDENSETEEPVADETSKTEEESEAGDVTLGEESEEYEKKSVEDTNSDISKEKASFILSATEDFRRLLEAGTRMALLYKTNTYGVRAEADENSAVVANIEIGTTLYIRDVSFAETSVWYYVSFLKDGCEQTGFVECRYLAYADEEWIAWEQQYIPNIYSTKTVNDNGIGMSSTYASTSDIDAFPNTYQSALRALKNAHPNWTFVPMNTGLDFSTVVKNEMYDSGSTKRNAKSLIQATTDNKSKGWVGDACPSESGWYYATESGVSYHMDPRNFLTEDYIFMFEQLTFNASYHSASAVQNFLNSTFMSGTIPQDEQNRTYAQAFFQIGQNRKLSPTHLASRVYQEQGKGTSALISGTYPGYEGYYNYFNVNASGSSTEEKIQKGLQWAKDKGWNTRYKSLEGGAATIGNNYVLKGQDTIYLEKFNVNKDSPHGLYNHQYMQNIQAPRSEGYSTKKIYAGAGSLNSAFVFKIPVYTDMPGGEGFVLDKKKVTLAIGETAQLKASYDGDTITNNSITWSVEDSTIATVKDGVITAHKVGETTVTAVYQKNTATCIVKVTNPLQSISLLWNGQPVTEETSIVLRRPDTVVIDAGELAGFTEEEKKRNIAETSLQVQFSPEDTSDDKTITWTSSNSKIATVTPDQTDSSKAVIRAVASGEVTIKAKASKAGNQEAICKIKVIAPIYKLVITDPSSSMTEQAGSVLNKGQTRGLVAEYWPKDTTSDTTVTWESSHPEVATVKAGKVTGVSEGTTTITASVIGDEKVYRATYDLTVEGAYVTFMAKDNKTILKKMPVAVGATLQEEDFPVLSEDSDTESFLGWYTEPDGQGFSFAQNTVITEQNTVLYPCYVTKGNGFYVVPVGKQTYTGSAIKPEVRVYDSYGQENGKTESTLLVRGVDYTVTYKNNIKVSEAGRPEPTIVVKGKGNYEGTQKITFHIVPQALENNNIAVEDWELSYTGKIQKKTPVVYHGSKKLALNKDYTVTFPQTERGAYRDPGVYPVIIKGKGGYSGTLTGYINIAKKVSLSKVKIGYISPVAYKNDEVDQANGKGIEPAAVKVTYQNKVLVQSTDGGVTGDYTIEYSNNMQPGTATLRIKAVPGSDYIGSKSASYKIVAVSISGAVLSGVTDKTFTGKQEDCEQKLTEIKLTLNGETLTPSTDGGRTGDYLITYSGTNKAGRVTIFCQGINEYTGKVKKLYRILPQSIGDGSDYVSPDLRLAYYEQWEKEDAAKTIQSLNDMTASYVKGGTKPIPVLYYKDTLLVEGKDYSVKYSNHTSVTTDQTEDKKRPQITIVGKGNFTGKITGYFTVTDGRMDSSGKKLTMTAKDVIYNEKTDGYKASVIIKDADGRRLAPGIDYDRALVYTYEQTGEPVGSTDKPAAGTVIRVTAKGIGAYSGLENNAEISTTYRIVRADLSKAKVSIVTKEYENGRPVTLSEKDITVKMPGIAEPLRYGIDYVIDENSYEKNKLKGTAYVTIRGAAGSDYGQSKRSPFRIRGKLFVFG